MKILSYNVNGIRAAIKKGLIDFLKAENPDIVCFQELKALKTDIDEKLFEELGYRCYWFSAEKKGYSGVGIISKIEPKRIITGMGDDFFDKEGRTIIADFEEFRLINTYFPSGTSGDERQGLKMKFLSLYFEFIQNTLREHPRLIISGDYNIAHTEIDIHNPKGNQKTSGFLPEERQWMTQWFKSGMTDSFRHLHPDTLHAYTWWSARFPSVRLENKGWRIDYISVSKAMEPHLKRAFIIPEAKHSDHCPLGIELSV